MKADHVEILTPQVYIEPHAYLLIRPIDEQLLYKIMSVENLLRSIKDNYLYFNRVDSYTDFPDADPHDGRQLPKDQTINSHRRFEKAPYFSMASYYDQSRARTYACCFSLENSDFIWNNYANGSERGKVCIVFEFGKLRAMLNQVFQPKKARTAVNGYPCGVVFPIDYLNYGIVKYVEWDAQQENAESPPNPIIYTYLKDRKFSEEKELRISISTIGMGQFAHRGGSTMQFPLGLQQAFDFKAAIANGTLQQILYLPDTDSKFLQEELHKLQIDPIKD